MTSVGNIGSLRSVPAAPSAAVLNEALKLLATFGDSKSISALLEQVRDVLTHNEQVISQFDGLKHRDADVARREREVREAEARVDGKLAQYRRIMTNVGEYLEKEPGEISRKVDEETAHILKPGSSDGG